MEVPGRAEGEMEGKGTEGRGMAAVVRGEAGWVVKGKGGPGWEAEARAGEGRVAVGSVGEVMEEGVREGTGLGVPAMGGVATGVADWEV